MPNGRPLHIELDRLINSRLLVTAMSGAGKSWALRRLLEQTHGRIQHLVIDPEGEFFTLRERHDYVLIGKGSGADCAADPKSAALLARRLLELHVSAILDIYELDERDRKAFVARFLGALVNAPRALWHPALVVVDEAHIYAPEKGQAESAGAVNALMTRGRKRGFAGCLATQRLSELSKTAAAQAGNVLIGRARLDLDVRRSATALGWQSKGFRPIRSLKDGQFFAYGPALSSAAFSDDVVRVMVGGVRTTHPKAGSVAPPVPPPRGAVSKALRQLEGLAEKAAEEERTLVSLEAQVRELRACLERERGGSGAPGPEALEEARRAGSSEAESRLRTIVAQVQRRDTAAATALDAAQARLHQVRDAASEALDALGKLSDAIREPLDVELPARGSKHAPRIPARTGALRGLGDRRAPAAPRPPSEGLTGPEQKILDAIAWLNWVGVERPSKFQVAAAAGYAAGGGGFRNPLGSLRTGGLVEYGAGDSVVLTTGGENLARTPEALTLDEVHLQVMGTLPGGTHRRILRYLLDAHPKAIPTDEVAAALGMASTGGGFRNPLGRLRTLGLIEYPERGMARAVDALFPRVR